jgi:hypothetical protein
MISSGDVIDNLALYETFGVGNSGGMRRSGENSCLVIIADWTISAVKNRWEGDILHYTGQGKGNQKIEKQNQTLANSKASRERLFLFEVKNEGEYTYYGEVQLAGEPYQESQKDGDDQERTVWMFPLRLKPPSASDKPMPERIPAYDRALAKWTDNVSTHMVRAVRKIVQAERKARTSSGAKWGFITEETELELDPPSDDQRIEAVLELIGRSDEFVRIRETAFAAFDMPDPPESLTENSKADVDELRAAMDQRKPKKHRFDDFK